MKFETIIENVKRKNPGEEPFHQAVEEVLGSIWPIIESNKKFQEEKIVERLIEPERMVVFRVSWVDDMGEVHVNRGYRVQWSSAIGPYKGGLRFHPTVNAGVLKFLAFEQTFKNSLTGLPMGGGKGGSDFDPKGKSDAEIMRFCQAFMAELYRHIGQFTDVPAGDIGVGAREIGYLYGYYKKLVNEFTGVLTGKGEGWGGSLIRPEATGYGLLYFVSEMLKHSGRDLQGLTYVVSGSGNVAQYAVEKAIMMGGKVLTMSDSDGFIYDKDGITLEKLEFIKELKNEKRGRIEEYAEKFDTEYFSGKKPWSTKADVALPCATQNEIDIADAEVLIKNNIVAVGEGANMPTTLPATKKLILAGVLVSPSKASNAGGVAVSGLEMSQNSLRFSWTKEEVDQKLQEIMRSIHERCIEYGTENGKINYINGANIAGFVKVADAMIDQGLV